MIEGGDGEAMSGGGGCDEEVEVSDLLPNLLLACLHLGETLPNIRASFQDFETVFQQFAVATPEAFTSDREQAPLDFGGDNDAGKARSISDFFPALKSRLVGGLFQGLRKDRGIKKPFHEDSSSGLSVEELRSSQTSGKSPSSASEAACQRAVAARMSSRSVWLSAGTGEITTRGFPRLEIVTGVPLATISSQILLVVCLASKLFFFVGVGLVGTAAEVEAFSALVVEKGGAPGAFEDALGYGIEFSKGMEVEVFHETIRRGRIGDVGKGGKAVASITRP